MRRTVLFILVAGIVMTACTNDDFIAESSNLVENSITIRSTSDAIMIAQSAFSEHSVVQTTRFDATRTGDIDDVVVVRNDLTDDARTLSDTLIYVVNYRNNGFAVISANPNVEPLLAFVESGHYTANSDAVVAGFEDFMKKAKLYSLIGKSSSRAQHPHAHIDTLITSRGPYLSVKWGQDHYAGQYCLYGICGCGPLAAAQVLSFYRYPSSIELTYSDADMTTQLLDWDDIRHHRLYYEVSGQEDTTYCTASDSAHNAIGRLCRQLGELSATDYIPIPPEYDTIPGTIMFFLQSALQQLGMNCSSINTYSSKCTKTSLTRNRLIIMAGENNDENDVTGHIWVVDGFYDRNIIITDTIEYLQGLDLPPYYISVSQIEEYYNHINWGWNGLFNGYFLDNVFMVMSNSAMLDDSPYTSYDLPDDYSIDTRYFVVYKNVIHKNNTGYENKH